MDIKKRIFVEKPKIDDLFKFLVFVKADNMDVSYDKVQQNFRCEVFRQDPSIRVVQRGLTASMAVEKSVIGVLKSKI